MNFTKPSSLITRGSHPDSRALSRVCLALALAAASANADISITDITARQRWPWNGLVDIDFTITGAAAGDAFAIDIDATAASGATSLSAKTYVAEPVAGAGANRIVWDLGADYPELRANDLLVSVTATPLSDSTPIYMVIDLSGGADATKYPVRYTTQPPAHVQGAADEPCQTTELWMRRIHAADQTFVVAGYGTPSGSNNNYWTKLTKDFYIGIFETTQQQWFQITGTWPSKYSNEVYRASRPLDRFYANLIFGNNGATWSDENQTLSPNCLMQQLRNRTGLATLNLPTEAQWQFAVCAGTITTPQRETNKFVYQGPNGENYTYNDIARTSENKLEADSDLCSTNAATACVGSYKPNAFGLYDMLGNVWEDVLDSYVSVANLKAYYTDNNYDFPICDPQGLSVATATSLNGNDRITARGGGHLSGTSYAQLWTRKAIYKHYTDDSGRAARGFRFCVTVE